MINTTSQGTALQIDPAIFSRLYELDISKYVEKRPSGGSFTASYLSWSVATLLLKKDLPNVMVDFETEPESGGIIWVHTNQVYVMPYLTDGVGRTSAIFFPVMDNRFQAIERPDVRAISDACQRGAVKAIATFTGLGLKLYTGEEISGTPTHSRPKPKFPDTPEHRRAKKIADEADRVVPLAEGKADGEPWGEFVLHFGKNKGKKLSELNKKQLSWYQNEWSPNPDFAKIVDDDLRKALDESMGKVSTNTGDPAMDGTGEAINDMFDAKPSNGTQAQQSIDDAIDNEASPDEDEEVPF